MIILIYLSIKFGKLNIFHHPAVNAFSLTVIFPVFFVVLP
ncbi:hypothetical protein NIES37_28860 [Tolypothrix tenuis PCC 7101]|uniref:Uncharacterized protein n=1 Tax=Tolypothrix tenuis PCC 7101 TaxID=231146 RepID=A0A1Z4MZJ2_9CYAN|nr:hypothetical protein NIES37_28860 [Tolypothrix tenuis PCC 7101]BAZ77173.1 hypothetical protein NIES50_57760 [Aulosira laxa NIES-50]